MSDKKKRLPKMDRLRSLASRIAEDYRTIQNLYQKNDGQKALARFLEERASVLITPDYQRVRGGASAPIWKKARDHKARLELRTASIFLGDAIGVKKRGDREFDAAAFVVHEVHFIEKAGPVNATGYLLTVCGHDVLCPWF